MNSVGSFFSSVTKFYNEINPATLSGAIDIIVVQQADGDLACSPFHVRFGKLSVLRPQEKVVEVRVNGEKIAFPMKVGDEGEAFFVLETDDYVPDEFATSPIARPADEADLAPVDYFDLGKVVPQTGDDGILDNGYVSAASGHGSAFEESLKDDSDRDSVFSVTGQEEENKTSDLKLEMPGSFNNSHELLQEPESPLPTLPSEPSIDSKSDKIPKEQENGHAPSTQRDSIDFPVDKVFPVVVHEEHPVVNQNSTAQKSKHGRRASVVFDMTGYKTETESESSDDEGDLPSGILSDSERYHPRLRKKFGKNRSQLSTEQRQQLIEDIRQGAFLAPEENPASAQASRHASRSHRRKKRSGIPNGWQGRKGRKRANSLPSASALNPDFLDINEGAKKLDQPDLEVAKATSEVAPRREPRPAVLNVMSDTEMDYESRPEPSSERDKGWSWGWGGAPVQKEGDVTKDESNSIEPKVQVPEEIETKEFQTGSSVSRVAISLCGEEDFGKDLVACHKAFNASLVTFEAFSKDPTAILADRKLVCYIDGRFYNWSDAMPQLASMLFFHQPLFDASTQGLRGQKNLDKASSTRFGSISRWFRKAPTGSSTLPADASVSTATPEPGAITIGSDDEELQPLNKALRSKSLPPIDIGGDQNQPTTPPVQTMKPEENKKRYAKTLRLSSEQLKSLGLKKGPNTVSFSITSNFMGTATCDAKIFLWDYDSRVVISDIDGTITKSDALGHIFAIAGRDWTHLGVAKLFTDIRNNGYHILYLTSRAIGQADYTRNYLKKVEQNSFQLPDGPVIMSPDRLFSAFHREVIIRKPEVFKMACLRDIKKLFDGRDPFYAGFGNRITDALSYRAVNVPSSRIFTIDSNGEVKLELLSAFKSSYIALNDLVNEIFPGQRVAPEFNDWNYWKADISTVTLPDLPMVADIYSTNSSASLLSSTTSVIASLTSTSTTNLAQPTSPTSPVFTVFNSDEENNEQESATKTQIPKDLKDDKKAKSGSPSMLSALVPTRLMRAVRSGSTSSQVNPMKQPSTQSPGVSPTLVANDEAPRSVSPQPLDDHKPSGDAPINSSQSLEGALEEEEEEVYDAEEEYQGDYEDGDEEEMYSDEDDEFVDQIEEDLEEPFL